MGSKLQIFYSNISSRSRKDF